MYLNTTDYYTLQFSSPLINASSSVDHHNGTFSTEYFSTTSGTYELTVTCTGVNAASWNFNFTIYPGMSCIIARHETYYLQLLLISQILNLPRSPLLGSLELITPSTLPQKINMET